MLCVLNADFKIFISLPESFNSLLTRRRVNQSGGLSVKIFLSSCIHLGSYLTRDCFSRVYSNRDFGCRLNAIYGTSKLFLAAFISMMQEGKFFWFAKSRHLSILNGFRNSWLKQIETVVVSPSLLAIILSRVGSLTQCLLFLNNNLYCSGFSHR